MTDSASVQGRGLSAPEHDGMVPGAAMKRKNRSDDARAELCGVRSALTRDPLRRTTARARLDSFAAARARAYEAAAIELRGAGAGANFKQPPTGDDDEPAVVQDEGLMAAGHAALVRATREACSVARTEFLGVYRSPGGEYVAQIWDPSRRAGSDIGTFRTAEEAAGAWNAAVVNHYGANFRQTGSARHGFVPALSKIRPSGACEEAAGAWDAAAGRLHGAATKTIFSGERDPFCGDLDGFLPEVRPRETTETMGLTGERGPRCFDLNVLPEVQPEDLLGGTCAGTNIDLHGGDARKPPPAAPQETAEELSGKPEPTGIDLNKFPEVPALESLSDDIIPVLQFDDLGIDLSPAEWQQLGELLDDMESTDLVA